MKSVVLGGGISGLTTAYYLSKFPKNEVTLFESSERLGGWIKSSQTKSGTVFEHGPRTLRCSGPAAQNTLFLVKELGLYSKVRPVLRSNEAVQNRMIFINEELINLPNSWTAVFKIKPPFIKPFIFAIVKDLKTSGKCVTDESVHEFVTRRFGKEYAEILLSAMVCGIFAGDSKDISVKALLNELFEKEQKYGSVCKGLIYSFISSLSVHKAVGGCEKNPKYDEANKWFMWSFEKGLETLPRHLGYHLERCGQTQICLNSGCSKISFKNNNVLITINGQTEYAEHLFSTIPSMNLAAIMDDEHSFLKRELSLIPFVNVATVSLEYDGDLLKMKGFGFLVPPNQNLPILGIIFDSCIFPQVNKTVLSVMMGGKWFQHYFGSNPDSQKFIKVAKSYISKILKIEKEPENVMVNVMENCIPQYIVGHSERIRKIRKYIIEHKLPITIVGNSFDGVGVNDAILSAKVNVNSTMQLSKNKLIN